VHSGGGVHSCFTTEVPKFRLVSGAFVDERSSTPDTCLETDYVTIPTELIKRVEDAVIETLLRAQALYGRMFDLPDINFELRGRVAGRAWWPRNQIQLNPVFLIEQPKFIEETVPHEIAHLLTRAMNGPRVRPHGPEWKKVMADLGYPPIRCHNYDLTNAVIRRQRRHDYRCTCGVHPVPTITHRRIQRGAVYSCRKCHSRLLTGTNLEFETWR
jgi:SprT protein